LVGDESVPHRRVWNIGTLSEAWKEREHLWGVDLLGTEGGTRKGSRVSSEHGSIWTLKLHCFNELDFLGIEQGGGVKKRSFGHLETHPSKKLLLHGQNVKERLHLSSHIHQEEGVAEQVVGTWGVGLARLLRNSFGSEDQEKPDPVGH